MWCDVNRFINAVVIQTSRSMNGSREMDLSALEVLGANRVPARARVAAARAMREASNVGRFEVVVGAGAGAGAGAGEGKG